jgi:hypothetical protein
MSTPFPAADECPVSADTTCKGSSSVEVNSFEDVIEHASASVIALESIHPPKAVCADLLIAFKSVPYVMRYSDFPH